MKNIKKLYFIIFIAIFGWSNPSKAAHILSGSLSYECLGNDQYTITLEIYRDCASGGALFDNPAAIAIYSNGLMINNFAAPQNGGIEAIFLGSLGSCVWGLPNYCVEKGTYTFNVELPETNESYTLVYQRCCWSTDFSNIENPAERGVTIKTEITPAAQTFCNNQPGFGFPLTVVSCVNELTSLPLASFDNEGDSLVYELCGPIEGGGPLGTSGNPGNPGNPNSCDGVQPNPPCPPPFDPLPFASGFDINNPFPTANGIVLDQSAGAFEYTPTVVGRFVFALCMTEYRNGQQIGYYCQNLELSVFPDALPVNSVSDNEDWKLLNSFQVARIRLKKETISSDVNINIFDINGRLISRHSFQNTNEVSISTDSFGSGIYFIHIQEPTFTQVIKLLHF